MPPTLSQGLPAPRPLQEGEGGRRELGASHDFLIYRPLCEGDLRAKAGLCRKAGGGGRGVITRVKSRGLSCTGGPQAALAGGAQGSGPQVLAAPSLCLPGPGLLVFGTSCRVQVPVEVLPVVPSSITYIYLY